MTQSNELLSCPFCGGEVELKSYPEKRQADIHFISHFCGALSLHWDGKRHCSAQDAIAAWNTRAPAPKAAEDATYHDTDYSSPLRPKRLEYTMCGKIYAVQENGERHMFMDVRGWGYLTGGGAKKLPYEEATGIQDKWANEVCNLWNAASSAPVDCEPNTIKLKYYVGNEPKTDRVLGYWVEHDGMAYKAPDWLEAMIAAQTEKREGE